MKEKFPHWLKSLLKPDVIKLVQIKFVATAMGILILVFLIMLGSINMIMKTVSQSQSMKLLIQIAESERYNILDENEADRPFEDIPPPEQKFFQETEIKTAERQGETIRLLGWMPERDWNRNEHQKDDRPPEFDDFYPDNNEPDRYPPDMPPWEQESTEQPVTQPEQPSAEPETISQTDSPDEAEMPAEPAPPEEMPVQLPEEMTEFFPEEISIETAETETESSVPETTTEMQTSLTETTIIDTTTAETTTEPPPPPEKNNQNPAFHMEIKPDKWKVNIMLDHFALMADHDGNFLGIRNTENYTDEQAEEMLNTILSTGKQQGMYGWLQYYQAEKEYGTLLVVTDKTSDQGLLNNLFRTTVIVGIIMLLVLFVFLIFFSRWITQPARTALERQKQFVSDASHELKTPIAVLTANVDILQDEIGENKWLNYIQEQTDRMNQLVSDLLRLARMDNGTQEYSFTEFNLSTAIEATVLPFESQAFELHKNLEMDIQPDIFYHGSQQHIRQLAAIFIDNAMKYSNENGTIKVSLLRRGNDCILEFYNTGCEISRQETEKIFERFYRGDRARNNQGKNGYGLGLAIAKSIMEIHQIKIQVTCEQGEWIRFLMIM